MQEWEYSMTRKFKESTNIPTRSMWYYGGKWQVQAYPENGGSGPKAVKNLNFVERIHYGVMDNNNYGVIPDEKFLVPIYAGDPFISPRVFDFVADAWAVMNLNFTVACQKNLIQKQGAAFAEMKAIAAYENPKLKYRKYIGNVLNNFNLQYIPQQISIKNITSYDDYVKHFFKMLENNAEGEPVTLSRWLKSNRSSILDSGLAIKYFDIPPNADQRKINEILDHPSFPYFKNLCLNMGFSILHNTPNILLFDIASPAGKPYLSRKGMYKLDTIFNNRFNKSYMHDMELLYNNINLYYNRFVLLHPQTELVYTVCKSTVKKWMYRDSVDQLKRPPVKQMLKTCLTIRNIEEGRPYTSQKVNDMFKKAKYLQKRFDTNRAMGYITSMFKDQVWNKDGGYDDLLKSLQGKTTGTSGNATKGEQPSGNGMGGSSGY